MKFQEFKDEMRKQIHLNATCFRPKETQILYDFLETIQESDFEEKAENKEEIEK